MSINRDPSSYYYSTYHLARDFIGTAAPFTFFITLVALLSPSVEYRIEKIVDVLVRTQSWIIGLFFVGIYVLTASMAKDAVRDVVQTEYELILATVAWIEQGRIGHNPSNPTPAPDC